MIKKIVLLMKAPSGVVDEFGKRSKELVSTSEIFKMPPEPLDAIQIRTIRRKPEGKQTILFKESKSSLSSSTPVIRGIIEDNDNRS